MELSEPQQHELLAALSARGEVPAKFAYLGDGASRWDSVYSLWNQTGEQTGTEKALVDEHIDAIMHVFDTARGVNVVDLGCGNGLPAAYLLKQLAARDLTVSYTAIDISPAMLALASENITQQFPSMKVHQVELDMESGGLREHLRTSKQRMNYPTLMISLGDTLAGHRNLAAVLMDITSTLTPNDYLLIGSSIQPTGPGRRVLAPYNTLEFGSLVTGPAHELGLIDATSDYELRWNPHGQQVEGWISLTGAKTLTIAGQALALTAGEELMVLRLRKPSESALVEQLTEAGLRLAFLTTAPSRSYALALLQPAHYSAR